jgi:hypothetical protein
MTTSTVPAPTGTFNHYGTWASVDAAIVAIALLRAERRSGQKGIGANRDDWPIFKQIADAWASNKPIAKETIFQARHRVQKYHRQVLGSLYAEPVRKGHQQDLVRKYAEAVNIKYINQILETELQVEQGYGDW